MSSSWVGRRAGAARFLFGLCLPMLGMGLFSTDARADSRSEYRRVIAEAVREYRDENWDEAETLFQKAHSIRPSARTLRGMGLAAFKARRYVDAIQWFSEALESSVQPLTKSMRSKIEPMLARAEKAVGFYELELAPDDIDIEDLAIEVDGRAAVIDGTRLKLDPGERELVAMVDGFEEFTRSLDVTGGDNGTLRMELKPILSGESDPSSLPTPADEGETDEPAAPGSWQTELLPWILVGAGGGLAVTGGVLLALTAKDISTVENADGDLEEIEAAQDRVPLFSTLGFGLAAVGVAAAGTGVVLLVLNDESAGEAEANRKTRVVVAPTGVFLKKRF